MQDHIKQLRELLGYDVLLLPWPFGSKGTRRKWGHLTVASMTAAYLARLAKGNIGVALGEKSGGLCSIDIDDDKFVPEFEAVNPQLVATLRSRGARGCNFWIRFNGEYPRRTKPLKSRTREDWGEFRSNRVQTIIHGKHPSGCLYSHNNRKPLVVEFGQIVWPVTIANPPMLEPHLAGCTEEPEETEDTDETKDTDVVSVLPSFFTSILTVEDALRVSLPDAPRQNNHHLFTLARAVKTLELEQGKFTPEKLKEVFGHWHDRAKRHLRPEQTKEDYMIEFFDAYRRAKHPIGGDTVTTAWQKAQDSPPPPEAMQFTNPQRRQLVALCWQLQVAAGDQPFYLSCRVCQRLFKHDTHSTAATWLSALVALGILDEVEKGAGIRASRYLYISSTAAS